VVIICPDHGNGGVSIGNRQSGSYSTSPYKKIEYDNLNIASWVVGPLDSINWTGRKLAQKIIADSTRYFIDKTGSLRDTLRKHYALDLPADSLARIESIVRSKTYAYDRKRDMMENFLGSRYSEQHFIGWTTTGHTGEDVFLGIYAPRGIERLTGVVENTDISDYIVRVLGMSDMRKSGNFFNRLNLNSREFPYYPDPVISGTDLVFHHKSKDAGRTITIPSNRDYYLIGNKRFYTKTLIVNINMDYYVPMEIIRRLKTNN
jgi:alkaline phosphatase